MLDAVWKDRVRKTLSREIGEGGIAGANLLVIHKGKEIFYHEDGFASMEKGLPVRRDTIFRIYSMTKPVTAAAVMILLERGEIDLFDPVSRFLEGFRGQMVCEGGSLVPAEREVNIRDLLSMTSGLVYPGEDRAGRQVGILFQAIEAGLTGGDPIGTVEAMNRLGGCPLAFQPGTSWQYGTSADVLGAVVEVVSGMRFGEFLEKEIFGPLGMKDTAFWVPEENQCHIASVYSSDGKGGLSLYTGNNLAVSNKMDKPPAFESGGAGLASTIDDYSRFAMMLMNEGELDGVRILQPKTIRYMTCAALTDIQQKAFEKWMTLSGHSYGNLMRVMKDCSLAGIIGSPGEYGWDGWLGTYFCNCPKDGLTFLLMMQKTDAGTTSLTRKIRNIILSSFTD